MAEKEKVINPKDIIDYAYERAIECYGIKGFVAYNANTKDKFQLLTKEKAKYGIFVKKVGKFFDVDLFVVVASDIKITEAIFECQKVVRYALNKNFNSSIRKVNVYAMGII